MNSTAEDLLEELNKELADEFLPVTIFVGIEIVVGCFANAFLFYWLARHREPSNYRTLVMFLAFVDFLCTITTMPGDIVSQRLWYHYPSHIICKTKDFFNIFTVSTEAFCLFLIAYERYRRFSSNGGALEMKSVVVLCCFSSFLAAMIASPVTLLWGLRSYSYEFRNVTVNASSCARDNAFRDTYWPEGYEFSVGGVVVLAVIATAFLYVKIDRQATSSSGNMANDSSVIRRQTRIFCAITLLFFITTCTYFIMIGLHGNPNDVFEQLSNKDKVIYNFFLRFYFIQHVFNPLIYVIGDIEIRHYIRTCICRSCQRNSLAGGAFEYSRDLL